MSTVYFAPDGLRLFLNRALAAPIEVRLGVGWPVKEGRRLIPDDFAEPRGGGYTRKRILPAVWQIRATDAGTIAEAPVVIFPFTGKMDNGRHVVAHLYVDEGSGQLLWAARLEPPVPVDGPGELELVPILDQGGLETAG